jgi:hypothetical protein
MGLSGYNTESLIVGNVFGECHAKRSSFVDFENSEVHWPL